MLVVLVYSNSSSAPKRASSTVLRASSLSTRAIAAATMPKRMSRPSRLCLRLPRGAQLLAGVAQALGRLAQVLLDLAVAGHGLDRALAVAGGAAVGAASGLEGVAQAVAQLVVLDQALHIGVLTRGPRSAARSAVWVALLSWPCPLLAGSAVAAEDSPCGGAIPGVPPA